MDGRRLTRRGALGTLGGLVAVGAGISIHRAVDRWESAASRPSQAPTFPSWVSPTPRSRQAYEAAYGNLELMATLPCYCGCAFLPQPRAGLRECVAGSAYTYTYATLGELAATRNSLRSEPRDDPPHHLVTYLPTRPVVTPPC